MKRVILVMLCIGMMMVATGCGTSSKSGCKVCGKETWAGTKLCFSHSMASLQ